MTGAIRPPWVEKYLFYKLPFNYCDRWCERCQLTNICRVFKKEEQRKNKQLIEGKNPDSWESVFEAIKEDFEEIRKMVESDAAFLGIDLKEVAQGHEEEEPDPENFSLYKIVKKFSKALIKAAEDLRIVPEDVDEQMIINNLEVISYYTSLLPAKTYRAITSKIEEENDPDDDLPPDSKNSAFILVNALDEINMSLVELINYSPLRPMRDTLRPLEKITKNLSEEISLEFDIIEEKREN